MLIHKTKTSCLTLIGTIAVASTCASAGILTLNTTFGFTDLNTSYDDATGLYLAQSSLNTSGDVTNWETALPLSADFLAGQIGVGNDAFVEFRMNLNNITGTSADGINGRLLIRDIDGDNFSGSFTGTWNFVGGFGFFDGIISSALFNNNNGDGIFESTSAGDQFVTPNQGLSGAISFLIQMPDWFDAGSFEERSSQGDGMLFVPTPGSFSLLAIGGVFASRRRRR